MKLQLLKCTQCTPWTINKHSFVYFKHLQKSCLDNDLLCLVIWNWKAQQSLFNKSYWTNLNSDQCYSFSYLWGRWEVLLVESLKRILGKLQFQSHFSMIPLLEQHNKQILEESQPKHLKLKFESKLQRFDQCNQHKIRMSKTTQNWNKAEFNRKSNF